MTSRDGTAVAFERLGAGPPVVLVDGALCSRAFGPMPKLAPLLAQHFTVFAYDRRGRGGSGDTAPYAVEREIEDLAALVAEAGGRASVYAVSSGAALALAAAGAGVAIDRLALFEPPFMVGEGGHRPPPDHREQLARMAAEGRRGDAVRFFMGKVVGMPGLLVHAFRFMPMWPKLKAVAHTLAYDAAVMGDYSLPAQRAAAVDVPTLVMSGDKSQAVLQRAAQALAEAMPNARHRTLVGQSHSAEARAVAPVLAEFFGGAAVPPAPQAPQAPQARTADLGR